MRDYAKYKDLLANVCAESESEKPVADDNLMNSMYDALREAASAMDCDALESVFKELEDYSIPDSDKEKYGALREKADNYDYDGILELLNE